MQDDKRLDPKKAGARAGIGWLTLRVVLKKRSRQQRRDEVGPEPKFA